MSFTGCQDYYAMSGELEVSDSSKNLRILLHTAVNIEGSERTHQSMAYPPQQQVNQ